MISLIRRELNELEAGRRALRSFGLLVGTILILIAAVVVWRSGWTLGVTGCILVIAGALLVSVAAVQPRLLYRVYFVWMGLALVLGLVMTRVLLTVVFFLIVVPTGLLLRIFGKDPLHRTIDREASSYWIPKSYDDSSSARFEKYY